MDEAVNPIRTLQNWLYYREFGEAYEQTLSGLSDSEKLINKLREIEKERFGLEVQIVDDAPKADDNFAGLQSLAEILQERMEMEPAAVVKLGKPTGAQFRQAALRSIGLALLLMLILGAVFLIKSVR